MKSLKKKCWIIVLPFSMVMVTGCARIPKKQAYLKEYKVSNEGEGCANKGMSIEFEPDLIRSKSLVKRAGVFIFPVVFFNYWHEKYDYDVGNEFFNWKITEYIQTHLQNDKRLCEFLGHNEKISVNIKVKSITVRGSFIMNNVLTFLLLFIPYSKESCVNIISEINSDIRIKIGSELMFEKSISTAYKTPGQVYHRANPAYQYIPIDIKNNFNSCLNKYAGEVSGYISIANKNSESGS